MRTTAVLTACGLWLACGTSVDLPSGALTQEIVGGATAPNDAQVHQLRISVDGTTVATTCSATLIGARTLLTAAHCVDPKRFGATALVITATRVADVANATAADWVKVVDTRLHPEWTQLSLDHDVALALLETSPGLTPMAWNAAPLTGKGGQPLRVVGYGTLGPTAGGAGVRRQVDLTFRQIEPERIKIGDQQTAGICGGDSGGPSLHTFADGVERVVGVHSSSEPSCVDGTDQRVDVNAAFIRAFLLEKEPAACWDDGRCVSGCPTVDLDCVCAADGLCTDKCPSVLRDPDCPADCVENGVCSAKACPRPDVDCGNFSGTCLKPQDCLAARCVTDPQHTLPYCSAACASDAECPAAMECDFSKTCRYRQVPMLRSGAPCVPGTSLCEPAAMCLPDGAMARCMRMCSHDADCDAPQVCAGDGFCRGPMVVTALKTVEARAASGCAAAPGPVVALGLLAWVVRRRKTR